MDRRRRTFTRRREHAPEVVREERHERRDDAHALDEGVPERPQRNRVALPGPATGPPDVPVGDVVDERLVCTHDVDREPALVPGSRLRDERMCALDEPAVERLELPARPGRRDRSSRASSLRRSRSRRRTCHEFQSVSSFRWISCAGPNPKRRLRSGGCEQYCQRMTSAPMRANASGASIVFPHELCISRPVSSSIFS